VVISELMITFDSASGFIGLPIAQALVRAGHQVFGQTRSQKKAKQLIAEESRPATINFILAVILIHPIYSYPHHW
jgi:nucleoside-diphosphate-sugar epimerase